MNATDGCSVLRYDGYAAHPSREIAGIVAKINRGEPRMGSCRSARLLTKSSFAACARACLTQPFCEAVTWVSHQHDEARLHGSCFGRTAGTPATFVPAATVFGGNKSSCFGCTTAAAQRFVAGLVHCAACDLQQQLDALCSN